MNGLSLLFFENFTKIIFRKSNFTTDRINIDWFFVVFLNIFDCKMLPIGAVWAEYCRQCGVVDAGYYDEIEAYENEVLLKRV